MRKTGILSLTNGIPKLGKTRIGVYLAADAFETAARVFEALGFDEGDEVAVEGILDSLGGKETLLMSEVHAWTSSAASIGGGSAGSLGGPISPNLIKVTCKQCLFVNKGLIFIDFKHPPNCQNPAATPHLLKIF